MKRLPRSYSSSNKVVLETKVVLVKKQEQVERQQLQELVMQRKLARHVCGKVPEAAMYIDAVARESLVPWYELEVGGQSHEVYKLSP